jgi:hypothetical protein
VLPGSVVLDSVATFSFPPLSLRRKMDAINKTTYNQ